MATLNVEPLEDAMPLGCPCCTPMPSGLRGLVYEDKTPHAIYSARPSRFDDGPMLMSITVGRWEEKTTAADRKTVALTCFSRPDGPEIRAADFDAAGWPDMVGVGQPLSRSELEHDADYAAIIRLARAIMHQDRRVAMLAVGPLPGHGGFRADGPGAAV